MELKRVIIASALIALASVGAVIAAEGDVKLLLVGVAEIAAPGAPGPLCVYGNQAFPVVTGKVGKFDEPVVAASRTGKGRVVAFGHDGYFNSEALNTSDTAKFMVNAVRWAGDSSVTDNHQVAVLNLPGFADFLRNHGIQAQDLAGSRWNASLKDFDVLCASPAGFSNDDIQAVIKFIADGGGLVAGGLGWGWLQLNPGKELNDLPGNRLLASFGIIWADGMLDRTTANGFSTKDTPELLCHASRALDLVMDYESNKENITPDDLAQASSVVIRAAMSLPQQDQLLLPKLHSLLDENKIEIIPSEEKPVTDKEPLARLILTLQLDEMKKIPVEQIKPHLAASAFPGAVPDNSEKVTRTIEVDTGVPEWHSTGLYAAPGQLISVKIPETAVSSGLSVRIGAHNDTIWEHESWKRIPDICKTFPLNKDLTNAANAFGGPVYIEVPEGCKSGSILITISNCVEAPYYILGKTSASEWLGSIRNRPAPWAELETKKVILTLPSTVVRDLEDPKSLMEFWDKVADACADLAGWPLNRVRPERYVPDVQIGGLGYMHSGYPIMTHLDIAEVEVDKDRMMKNGHGGVWGLFHEMGHNHQSGDWTFEGTGEVTVNLFTLYVFDKVCGTKPGELRDFTSEGRTKMMKTYFAPGADFTKWKNDPFLALLMYIQIQEAFGWDAYKKVFAEYRSLPNSQRPKSDDEKRDQWLVRLSCTVGRNLGPFFQAWGVPTSENARASISNLPEWMPEGFPPDSSSP